MDRELVSSSSIVSIGYESDSETLEIEFKGTGVYQYYNVPAFLHERMMAADSVGKSSTPRSRIRILVRRCERLLLRRAAATETDLARLRKPDSHGESEVGLDAPKYLRPVTANAFSHHGHPSLSGSGCCGTVSSPLSSSYP